MKWIPVVVTTCFLAPYLCYGQTPSYIGEFTVPNPQDIEIAGGVVYVAGTGGGGVVFLNSYTTDGTFIEQIFSAAASQTSIGVAQGGDFYFNVYSTIKHYNSSRAFLGQAVFSDPFDVDVDSNGNVFVVQNGQSLPTITKLDSELAELAQWGINGDGDFSGGFDGPQYMAIGLSTIVIADRLHHRIQRYSLQGQLIDVFGQEGYGPGEFYYPSGIAISPTDGSIFVSDLSHRIHMYSSSWQHVVSWGGPGNLDGSFYRPGALAIAPNGNVYVADTLNNRVQIFSISTLGTTPTRSATWGRIKNLYVKN